MREIREIKVREIRKEKEEEQKEFLKIKPETDITFEECQKFWDEIFGGEV